MVHFSYYTWNKTPFHCVKGPWEKKFENDFINTDTPCDYLLTEWLYFLASDAPKVKSTATHHSRRKQPAMLSSFLHSKLWLLPPQALTAPTPTSDSFYPKLWLLPQFTAYSGIPCGGKCLSYFHLPLNFFKMDLSNSQQSHEWQSGPQTAWTLHCRMHCVWTCFYKTCILHFMFSSQIY